MIIPTMISLCSYGTLATHPGRGGHAPRGKVEKRASIMATETGSTGAPVSQPADVGLRREMGLIGAAWASETSIIGSGWLFGALFAAQAVRGAAIPAWLIAGGVGIVLA